MQSNSPTIILRHKKENLKKCSLRGLETRKDFNFHKWPGECPEMINYIYLTIDAPPLSTDDHDKGLLLIDGTWKLAKKMENQLEGNLAHLEKRAIPGHFRTAYPRKQTECIDPTRGLASLEALYIAFSIMGRETEGLLDNYYWKEDFLKLNNF